MDIDIEQRTAWAETGLTAAEYTTAAGAHGLATGFGDTGSVGIGGITLGGGVGYLVRKHGLTIDSLLAAEVVTADGQLLRVDAETHPDLFWAIRGGGGNFGVATRFKFRLHPVDTIVGGMLILPATPDVIASFIAEAEAAPEELSTIANVMPAPPMPFVPAEYHGQLIIMAIMVYAGGGEAGERAVAPFRALATPIADMIKPMRYPEIYPPDDDSYHPTAAARTMFVDTIDRGSRGDHRRSPSSLGRVDARGTARGCSVERWPACLPTPLRLRTARAGSWSTLPPSTTAPKIRLCVRHGSPISRRRCARVTPARTSTSSATRARRGFAQAYPGATWDRLAAIKRRYDPTNLFRLNQNIPPASERSEVQQQA